MENNLDKTNFEITKKLEQIEREKYTKRYNNLNYVDFSNPNADKLSSASTTTIKQETIEEAAKNHSNQTIRDDSEKSFSEGAKWQQERMYSEEEVTELLQKALTHKDDGEIGSLVTAQGEIRPANFFSWFNKFKKK